MRTVMIDDDGSEWSIEIFDGHCVHAPIKSVKQTPMTIPTSTGSKRTSKEVHPLFLNDFSTKVSVSGTRLTGQETANYTLTTRPTTSCRISRESTEEGHHASHSKKTRQIKPHPTIHAYEPLDKVPSVGYSHDHVQIQEKRQFAKSQEPIQVTKDASSSSSVQNASESKQNEVERLLPVYSFMDYPSPPDVVYIKTENEANILVQTLSGPLGFDMEWRVMWHPGAQERRTALVQLCDHNTILLIQVSGMKRFPRKVLEVIESADTVKTGANILHDGEKLFRDFGIQAKGLVELGAFATKADDKFRSIYNRDIVSLAKMVAMYLGRTLRKGQVRTSNWEAVFSRKMVEYAANDCHSALMVYARLQEIAAQAGKTLDVSTYARQVDPHKLKPDPTSLVRTVVQRQNQAPAKKLSVPSYCIPEPPRPQQLRAYKLWHVDKMPLGQMCMALRTGGRIEPLKESTVISYVVGALQADPRLPFAMDDLKALVLTEASSWQRHRQWIMSQV